MIDRLNEAIAYIEEHLTDEVEAEALARVAATSEYHFRRIFSALAGMPLSEYVRRRRLTLAAAEVLASDRTLLEVALRHGYGTGDSFARAFRAVHGVSPSAARRTRPALESQPRIAFRLTVEGSTSMRYRVVEKPAFNIVGLRARVPLVHEGMNPHIVAFLKGISAEQTAAIAALSDQEPRGLLQVSDGLSPGREEGSMLDYYRGVATSAPASQGMEALPVAAGQWAVFEDHGAFPQAVQYLWRDIFTQWFPSNPYRSRPGPELLRIELSSDGTQASAELWIPVESERQAASLS